MVRKWSLSRFFAVSVGGSFAFLLGTFVVLGIFGVDIVGGLQTYMNTVLNELIVAQESAGTASEQIFAIKQNASQIVTFSLSIVPSVVLLMGLFVALANYLLAKWIIRVPVKFAHFGDVARYSVPHYFVWITIALGSMFYIGTYVFDFGTVKFIALNGLIAISGIYFLQGILIVSFYMRAVKARFFRVLLYFTMFMFMQIVAPVLVILGFADLWIDFRRLIRKELNNKRSMSCK
jgi:hypothetical protein